ncbi:MAG TPA: MarR family transcriptional regulator [Acetobacteraceae bacterium]|jgi:DNA-binding MarR family transcriptional regulator/GNAT superfamily N-acetyltransferase|nr:MarR family transcriptional regulator [Acetobacteraceae bacterium]
MSQTIPPDMAAPIAAVRRFSRYYTRQIGLLDEGLLKSGYSLTEARVLYELATRRGLTATDLCRDLGIDPGYLSRLLKKFEERDLISRWASPEDARQSRLRLTEAGRVAFRPLDRASREQVMAMIGHLPSADITRLLRAMQAIETLMGEPLPAPGPVTIRGFGLGDVGWITHRHGILYAKEYGWDQTFEILVAEILAALATTFDPQREGSWIAERDGAVIGSAFVVCVSDTVAKLRLLYVEPEARGLGLGRQLVDACIGFAREKGYRTLTLWTNDVLIPARRIYQAAGFTMVSGEPVHAFGKDMVSETWELAL